MKTKLFPKFVAIFYLLSAISEMASAQGTAFTYQGRLNNNGNPANGHYDLIFQVFDAASSGSSIGGSIASTNVAVTNGLFTVAVDFGATPFTGPARWLQIQVSTNGAGLYSTLNPRQALTPAPYAIYANTASTVTNGAITAAQLAANSVATGSLQNNAVTAGKIASGQVVNSLQISAPAGGLALPYSGNASSAGSIFTVTNSGAGPAAVFGGEVDIGSASLGGTTLDVQDSAGRALIRAKSTGSGAATLWLDRSSASGAYSSQVTFYTAGIADFNFGTAEGSAGV